MAVFVDDMNAQYGRMKMVHMLASTDEELHEMAAKIGVNRKWWQSPEKTSGSHYDICLSKKAKAIQFGAIEITWRQAGAMNSRRRVTGELGKPEDAEEWLKNYMEERRKLKASPPSK
jgi:hypothetical protein